MGKSYKAEKVQMDLSEALANAKSDLQDLREECESAAGNFPNDSHPKAVAFSEAASALGDALDYLDEQSEPGPATEGIPVQYWKQVPRRKAHQPSKSIRSSNVAASLCAMAAELEEWARTADPEMGGTLEEKETARDLAMACQSAATTASDVDFPGMFG